MKRNHIAILAFLCLALAIPGCGKKDETAANGTGGQPQKKLKLAFVSNNSATFWTIARAGCEEAQKELGDVDVDFRIPPSGMAAEQQQLLDDLLVRGVDGVAVSPVDPANQTALLDKIASQALLITQDSDAPNSKRMCYIGTDNTAAGVEAGKLIKEALPDGGKIMAFVGSMDAQNAKERFAGIKQELQGSKIEIIDVRTDETDNSRAQRNAEDTLVKYPDVACLVGLWNYNGPAILNAVRGVGKNGKVKIVCFDDEDETLAGIAAGDIYGTVAQQPFQFGKQAITLMDKYLHGDKTVFPAEKKIFVPTINVTKANVAEFQANKKKLTGK
ncbi:MAG TPA: sugar-binding protein [Verrucomicrobiae bacterium]|nr:sugar-binding protein [Verrucomicrobiae bacterium]